MKYNPKNMEEAKALFEKVLAERDEAVWDAGEWKHEARSLQDDMIEMEHKLRRLEGCAEKIDRIKEIHGTAMFKLKAGHYLRAGECDTSSAERDALAEAMQKIDTELLR